MQTLSKGIKRPEAGDLGAVFFDALESNFQTQNDHTHRGEDSEFLDSSAVVAKTGSLSSSDWVLVNNGIYRQLVTMPVIVGSSPSAKMQFDSYVPSFRFVGGSYAGQNVALKVEKVSSDTFYAFINDSSQSLLILYT